MKLYNHPLLCNYYLTYRCNAKCHFCDIWEKPSSYINKENFEKNLDDLQKLKVKVIDFTGGEPLLHQELPYFLQKAKEKGFITTVTTNALLYPKCGNKIRGLIDMLHFSLDSANMQKHDIGRGVNCFSFVLKSIEIANSYGEKPDILFTVDENNFNEIADIYHYLTYPNQLMLIINPMFNYNLVGNTIGKEVLNELCKWINVPYVFLNNAFINLRKNGGNNINNPVCKAGSVAIVISPENNLILPCYHLDLQEIPINNNLFNLWNSQMVQETIKMEGKFKECQGCVINCYMQPSFSYQVNEYFWHSFPSTIKYSLEKWVLK